MKLLFASALGLVAASPLFAATPVDFKKEVRPIFEVYCLKCHGDEKPKGDLSMTTRAKSLKGGENGPGLVPGQPDKSPIYTLTILPEDHDDIMPPKGEKLSKAQQATLKQWIEEGAPWPEDVKLQQREKVDFVKQIKPIFIKMMAGTAGIKDTLMSDDLKIDGSKIDLVRFFTLIDKAAGTFAIVTK